ncbi:nucleolin 1-like [Raphanus sativus]|nr:nucleolin 1-like [Raphanus sativus]
MHRRHALTEHFASCGEITRVSILMDRETGASKGIAYLKKAQRRRRTLMEYELGGWALVVDEAKPRDNSGGGGCRFGGGSGRDGGSRGRFGGGGRRGGGRGGREETMVVAVDTPKLVFQKRQSGETLN